MDALQRAVGLLLIALLLPAAAAQAGSAAAPRDWSGLYAGAHGGWFWGGVDYDEPGPAPSPIDVGADGPFGGLLVGYSRQSGRLVFGLELDGGAGGADFGSGDEGGNGYSAFEVDWNGHARARAGVALGDTLLFVAGGLAVARVTLDDSDPGFGHDSATHLGWSLGGGAERALGDNLVLRLEYLYDDYGRQDYSIEAPAGPFFPSYAAEVDLTAHTLRAALAWHF